MHGFYYDSTYHNSILTMAGDQGAALSVAPLTMTLYLLWQATKEHLSYHGTTYYDPTYYDLTYFDSILTSTMAGGQGAALRLSAQGARRGESHEDSTVTTLTRAMLTMAMLTMLILTRVARLRIATRG